MWLACHPVFTVALVVCSTEAEQSFEQVRVPSDGDHGSWRTFCFGDEAADEPPHQPTMPVLMAIDQVLLAPDAGHSSPRLQLLHLHKMFTC
jgi:hypothetical protein